MINAQTLARRSWVGAGWAIATTLAVVVAVFNAYAGLALLLLAAVGGAALARSSGIPSLEAARQEPGAARRAWTSSPRRTIYAADGAEQVAFVVPAQSADGYQAVLTAEGYMLVNDDGEIVYTLTR